MATIILPSVEDEAWRYSRIAELDPDLLATATSLDPVIGRGPSELLLTAPSGDVAPVGTPDVFSELSAAHATRRVVRVAAGRAIAEPLLLTYDVSGAAGALVSELVIEAGADCEVTVVERFVGDAALVVPVTRVLAAPSARVRYLAVNELGRGTWFVAHQVAEADRDATVSLATVAFGGDYSRVRTECRLVGVGAHAEQIGLSFGEGNQMHDLRVLQEHVAPRTTSNLLFKGAVQDSARSVYTGLIRIGKQAKGANAFQTNRNLKLSDDAWADSVPNLDIENNDVRCSHASTVGPIDDDQRFYLESRGVPPVIAERLVVLGFFDEVLARLADQSLVPALHDEVGAKLDRRRP